MAEIFAFREDKLGFRYQLGQRTVLGRAPECNLMLFDRNASRHHAEILQKDDEKYFIADLGSTNGTLVNNQPITSQTHLEPYDTIKIGHELFIFEPGLSIIIGPAPSALIIEKIQEPATGLLSAPADQAAAEVDPLDVPALMTLSHRLFKCAAPGETETVIIKYLQERFGITFMALLWPSISPTRRLISLLTSHDDKRLLLGQTPFNRALKNREVLLWPSSISGLTFRNGTRHVSRLDQPALLGPLHADQETAGLMYLENQNQKFTPRDLKAFAALLTLLSPAVARMADTHESRDHSASEFQPQMPATYDTKVKIMFSTANQAAADSSPIMINGEAGTGKYYLAAYIHSVSPRKGRRLVSVNLARLHPGEIEATLFGVARASNVESRTGLVELADGGTLFLRHVECLPLSAQKLLLMAMEEGIFRPAGARRCKAVDLRVISSTSADLAEKIETGLFREDLYLRLNSLNISAPPLREIKDGLETILNLFLGKAAQSLGITFDGVDPGVMECLRAYHWPGNLTELEMTAGLLALFSRNGRVVLEDLPVHLRLASENFLHQDPLSSLPLIGEAERYQLQAAMSRCQGDLEQVAALLSQRPEDIIQKMRALHIDPINYQKPRDFQHLPQNLDNFRHLPNAPGPEKTILPPD